MVVIGVAGPAGSGKDSIASVLLGCHRFVRVAFADEVYREVSEAFDIPEEWLRDRETKEVPTPMLTPDTCSDARFRVLLYRNAPRDQKEPCFSPRRVMQLWGTDYRRKGDPSYWLRRYHDKLQSVARAHGRVVTPDVRFANEVDTLRHYPVNHLLHVTRPGQKMVQSHASEVSVPVAPQDIHFINNGTLVQLGDKVEAWITHAKPW